MGEKEARVRWERVFEDLEAQVAAADVAERDAETLDRTRTEQSALTLVDRLLPAVGQRVVLDVQGLGPVEARLEQVASGWLLLRAGAEQLLVPIGSVLGVRGLGRAAQVAGESAMVRRLGLGTPLRALARTRAVVRLVLVDGTTLTGTLDRVGADHVDLAEHPGDEPRLAHAVRGVRTVPWWSLACVRSY